MINTLRIIAEEAMAALILPRIEKAKSRFQVEADHRHGRRRLQSVGDDLPVHGGVHPICRKSCRQRWPHWPCSASGLFMCVGAIVMYCIGRAVDQKLYERKLGARRRGR